MTEALEKDRSRAVESITDSQLVCASAGTGKTTVLVNRYLEILRSGQAAIPEIVAITFTEKAADEMKSRIRGALRKDSMLLGQRYRAMEEQLSVAPISTVHSFCKRMIGENFDRIGIDPLFQILDDTAEQLLREDFLDQYLQDLIQAENTHLHTLLKVMNPDRIRAAISSAWDRRFPLDQTADFFLQNSPGDLLNHVEQWHHEDLLAKLQQLFSDADFAATLQAVRSLHCTNTADKLYGAFQVLLQADADIRQGRIPPSYATGTLKAAFRGNIGSQKNWQEEIARVKDFQRTMSAKWKEFTGHDIPFDRDCEAEQIRSVRAFLHIARDFWERYRSVLQGKNRLDFSSLESEALRLLESPGSAIGNYVARWKHLLVDEYQDINPVQEAILQRIQQLNSNLVTFFVGDEKQSIYRFRGAEVEIFNQRRKQSDPLQLSSNFRSTRALNRFFNDFFRWFLPGEGQQEDYEAGYAEDVRSHFPNPEADSWVDLIVIEKPDEENGQMISTPVAEATLIAEHMRQLHEGGTLMLQDQPPRKVAWKDMVVLLRSRTHMHAFENTFQKAGIPYYVLSGVGFYERREILDVLNMIRVLLNFYDEIALVAVLRSPMFGVSDLALFRLARQSRLMDGLERYLAGEKTAQVSVPKEDQKLLDRFDEFYREMAERLDRLTIGELVTEIVTKTDYLAILSALEDGFQRIANVQKLMDLAIEWSLTERISPIDFLRRMQVYRSLEIREGEANLLSEEEDSVRIMTIHAAKGLDFPIVYVPLLNAKPNQRTEDLLVQPPQGIALRLSAPFRTQQAFLYRHLDQQQKKRAQAEEQRLFYVAATRAATHLILAASEKEKREPHSLWAQMREYFDRESDLFRHCDVSFTEALQKHEELQPAPAPHLRIDTRQIAGIRQRLQPLSYRQTSPKITATGLAEWAMPETASPAPTAIGAESNRLLTPMELGSLVHQALSWWNFDTIESLQQIFLDLLKPYPLEDREKQRIWADCKHWGAKILEAHNPLRQLLGQYPHWNREIEVSGRLNQRIVEGKIDLLLHDERSYVIIDFKTDRIGEIPDETLLQKYNLQLGVYALLLQKWSGLPVSRQGLYFVRTAQLFSRSVDQAYLDQMEKTIAEYHR